MNGLGITFPTTVDVTYKPIQINHGEANTPTASKDSAGHIHISGPIREIETCGHFTYESQTYRHYFAHRNGALDGRMIACVAALTWQDQLVRLLCMYDCYMDKFFDFKISSSMWDRLMEKEVQRGLWDGLMGRGSWGRTSVVRNVQDIRKLEFVEVSHGMRLYLEEDEYGARMEKDDSGEKLLFVKMGVGAEETVSSWKKVIS